MLDGRLGGAEYIEEQFHRVAGRRMRTHLRLDLHEYIVTSMTVPSEVATSVRKEKNL